MSTFELYFLLAVLPQLSQAVSIASFAAVAVMTIAVVFLSVIGQAERTSRWEEIPPTSRETCMVERTKKIARFIPIPLFLPVLMAFIPDLDAMLVIVGWELGTSIEGIENVPANAVDYIVSAIEAAKTKQ